MKELIEKIESLISDTEVNIENLYDDKNCYSPRHYNAIDIKIECEKEHLESLNNFLKEIQEQESKPFNPVECGLIFDDDENAEHDGWFITKQYENNKTLRTVLIHVFDNKYSICVQAFITNKWVFQFYVINVITIPNHRQGVELLRNLGVIE